MGTRDERLTKPTNASSKPTWVERVPQPCNYHNSTSLNDIRTEQNENGSNSHIQFTEHHYHRSHTMMSAMDQDDDEFLYGDHSSTPAQTIPSQTSTPVPGLSIAAPPPAQPEQTATPVPTVQADQDDLEEGEEDEEEEVEVSDDEDVLCCPLFLPMRLTGADMETRISSW